MKIRDRFSPLAFAMAFVLVSGWTVSNSFGDIPPRQRVPFLSARETAHAACQGKILSSGLERRERGWYYTFEIASPSGRYEVLIDALTGKLRSQRLLSSR